MYFACQHEMNASASAISTPRVHFGRVVQAEAQLVDELIGDDEPVAGWQAAGQRIVAPEHGDEALFIGQISPDVDDPHRLLVKRATRRFVVRDGRWREAGVR